MDVDVELPATVVVAASVVDGSPIAQTRKEEQILNKSGRILITALIPCRNLSRDNVEIFSCSITVPSFKYIYKYNKKINNVKFYPTCNIPIGYVQFS